MKFSIDIMEKKKTKIMIWISTSLLVTLGICIAIDICWYDEGYVGYSQLSGVGQFVSTHYPSEKSVTAIRDFPNYDVWVETGTEIEFDFWENWDEIEIFGKDTIPASVLALIPTEINKYVTQHYDSAQITKGTGMK